MAKWVDHRQAVLDILKRRGKTKYWLAKSLSKSMSHQAVYGYLAGKVDLDYEKQHLMSRALGLQYTDE